VIKIEVYKHSDPTMAFGIYSTERSRLSGFRIWVHRDILQQMAAINFFKAGYYVKIRTYSKNEGTLKSAESLAHIVAESDSRKV